MSDSKETKTMISLRVPDDVLREIDARREPLGISRTDWLLNMTRWALANTKTIADRDERLAHNKVHAPLNVETGHSA